MSHLPIQLYSCIDLKAQLSDQARRGRMFYEIITGRSQTVLQVLLEIHRGFLDGHTLAKESDEGIFGAHQKETAVAIGEESTDGFACLAEIKMSFYGSKLNVK